MRSEARAGVSRRGLEVGCEQGPGIGSDLTVSFYRDHENQAPCFFYLRYKRALLRNQCCWLTLLISALKRMAR
jgi:hypothetical protein